MQTSMDRRSFLAASFGVAGAALLASCGGSTDATSTTGTTTAGGGDGTTKTKLGLLPITDVAPLFLARDKGVFAKHGLEIETTFAAGGAAILPSVESGEFDFGYSNIVSLLLFQSKGGKIKLVAGGGLTATGTTPDYSQMIVKADSPIQRLADLSGKKVAINTLKNALEIVVKDSVKKDGGDPNSIDFREYAFPDMAGALQSGAVDAIQHNEPFQTILKRQGGVRTLAQPFVISAPGEVLAFYFVKEDTATGRADLTKGFRDAMAEANTYAAAHEDELRKSIPSYAKVDPAVAAELVLPTFVPDAVKRSSIEVYGKLMTTYGLLTEPPDIDALLL
jgi:NitT/TauT family transport system substrate-binding protein